MRKTIYLVVILCLMATPAMAKDWFRDHLKTEKAAITFAQEVARGDYGIVSTDALKQMIDAKKPMLIVDTMPYTKSYKKNHIPGAVPFEFPIPEMTSIDEETKAKFLTLLGADKDRLLVFYCGFTKCTRSHNGAMWARKFGYTNVLRHPGGILAWKQADYPVAKVK